MGLHLILPAQQAGLQVGDIILQVNNQKIDGMETLQTVIQDNLGQPTEVTYRTSRPDKQC